MEMVGGLTNVMATGVMILGGMLGLFVLGIIVWVVTRRAYRLRGE